MHYESYSEARTHLKEILDAAESGRATTVRRQGTRAAVVDASRLRHMLSHVVLARAEMVAEDGGWSAVMPGLPIAADGNTFDEALDDLLLALREYADDWNDHLLTAPNHRENWGLVQLIELSTTDQLRSWVLGRAA